MAQGNYESQTLWRQTFLHVTFRYSGCVTKNTACQLHRPNEYCSLHTNTQRWQTAELLNVKSSHTDSKHVLRLLAQLSAPHCATELQCYERKSKLVREHYVKAYGTVEF
jgi:hypothetical protein